MRAPRTIKAVLLLLFALLVGAVCFTVWFVLSTPERGTAKIARSLGFTGDEMDVASSLRSSVHDHPAEYAPKLIPLLADADPAVRYSAGMLLSGDEMRGVLNDLHLDALIMAHRAGVWNARWSIGFIASPRAMDFLVDELHKEGRWNSQLKYAFWAAGEQGSQRLAGLYLDPTPLSPRLHRAASEMLRQMGDESSLLLDELLAVVEGQGVLPENRALAVEVLGLLESVARPAIPTLRKWAVQDPVMYAEAVQLALLRIEAPQSVERLSEELRLGRWRDGYELREFLEKLGSLGEEARAAGPAIVGLLQSSSDWAVREAAVVAIARVGYRDGGSVLVDLLSRDDSWRLAFTAAVALGQLGSTEAVPALERAAADYWFPPVRAEAARAVRVIRNQEESQPPLFDLRWRIHPDDANREFMTQLTGVWNRVFRQLLVRRSPGEISWWRRRLLGRDIRQVEFREEDEPPTVGYWDLLPVCGIKFAGGALLGYDNGEFGAGVVYAPTKGMPVYLQTPNVKSMHAMPFGVVVLTEAAMIGDDAAYLVTQGSDGIPVARPFKQLPWLAGLRGGLLPNGDLYFGGIVITRTGALQLDSSLQ
jgi:HEAT repeat protein